MRRQLSSFVLAAMLLLMTKPLLMAAIFFPLSPISGDAGSRGYDVSSTGMVSGTSYPGAGSPFFHPTRWNGNSTGVGLNILTGHQYGNGYGIAADGSVVVGESVTSSSQYRAVRWVGGQVFDIGFLPGGSNTSTAYSVAGDGSIIVGVSNNRAFRWTSGGGMQDLGNLTGVGSGPTVATRISENGDTIVGRSGTKPFYWTAGGGIQGLTTFSGSGEARGVSEDGTTVVGYSQTSSFSVGAVWVNGGAPVALQPHSGATSAFADDISGDGRYVVGNVIGGGSEKATLWDLQTSQTYDLQTLLVSQGVNLAGHSLREAASISGDSINGYTITGNGRNASNLQTGFLITNFFPTPVPEPTSLVLMAAAVGGACWRRLRRPMSA